MSVSLAARRSSIHTRLADLFCFMVSVYFIVHTCVISMTHVHPIQFLQMSTRSYTVFPRSVLF